MTEHPEHETPAPPARPTIQGDGWWDTIIEAILEEFEVPPEERERGPGR